MVGVGLRTHGRIAFEISFVDEFFRFISERLPIAIALLKDGRMYEWLYVFESYNKQD